jgi:hypothetical protein
MARAPERKPKSVLTIIGAVESADLPDLGIRNLPLRVDTGAATSALHVENLAEFRRGGRNWVSFDLHPDIHNVDLGVRINAPIKGRKKVKSSTADREERIVIDTTLRLGGQEWTIQLTLANRAEMTYPMLLGRTAMAGRFLVDPSVEYCLSRGATPKLK